jgi:uncharacterized membrane protein
MGFGVDLFWPGYLAAAFALAAAAAHVAAYRKTSRPVNRGTKAGLAAVRLAAVGLLVFVLWRPAIEGHQTVVRKGRLALLVDASKSMSIGDEESGAPAAPCSRMARASSVFSQSDALWRKIADSYDVSAYSFAKDISPLPGAPAELASKPLFGISADGPVTAIGDAIREVSRTAPPPEVIFILSDGLSNAGADPLDAAVPGGAAIYAISTGKDRPTDSTRDVAATGIYAPPEAFTSSEVTVIATFSMTGLEGRTVKAEFLVNGEVKETRELPIDRREAAVEARFTFVPEEAGPVRLEARAEPLADEIVAANNSAATYVDVKKGRMKVVYAEGTFRWEAKFLRLAIESAKDVDLRFVVPKGAGDPALAAALGEEWDVLVIGDLPAAFLPADKTASVAEAVSEKGKGILFLGGNDALGKGGYAETPLAACVPFEISPKDGIDLGLYRAAARPQGPYERLVAFGEGGSFGAWEKLPPLLAVNRVGAARPGATVLLEGLPVLMDNETGAISSDASRAPAPVLGIEDYGKGRTAAVTADGTWQWATGAGLSGTEERDAAAELHRVFWRQLVFWLAKREERGGVTASLSLGARRVEVGRSVEMEAKVSDSGLEPITDASVAAEMTSGGKTYASKFWLEGAAYKGEFKPPAAGDYIVKLVAARDGKEIAETSTAFVATAADAEFVTLVGRPAMLEALAKATGGKYAPADGAVEVLSSIYRLAKMTEYVKLDRHELWSSWWYVMLVVSLLAVEWTWRKFAGLV